MTSTNRGAAPTAADTSASVVSMIAAESRSSRVADDTADRTKPEIRFSRVAPDNPDVPAISCNCATRAAAARWVEPPSVAGKRSRNASNDGMFFTFDGHAPLVPATFLAGGTASATDRSWNSAFGSLRCFAAVTGLEAVLLRSLGSVSDDIPGSCAFTAVRILEKSVILLVAWRSTNSGSLVVFDAGLFSRVLATASEVRVPSDKIGARFIAA